MAIMEQPLTIVITGVFLVIALVGGLLQTGRRSLLYAAVGVALLTVGLLMLERTVVTPREQVKATLNVIAHDLEQNDVNAILTHISKDRVDLQRDAKTKMSLVEIVDVDIKNNLKVELYSDRGIEYAECRFNCMIRFKILRGIASGEDVRPFPQHFVVRFRQEDGRWRVRDYEMQDPRVGIGT